MSHVDLMQAVHDVIVANLPDGFVEAPRYKAMTTWVVSDELSPRTHDGRSLPVLALGARQSYVSLFVMPLAWDSRFRDWFDRAWRGTGCPLERGKVAVQLRHLDEVPLDVIASAVGRLSADDVIAAYERDRADAELLGGDA